MILMLVAFAGYLIMKNLYGQYIGRIIMKAVHDLEALVFSILNQGKSVARYKTNLLNQL